MIYDIKVFDKHGDLKEVINGQEAFAKIYEQDYKMVHKSQNLRSKVKLKKDQRKLTCPYCKVEFFTTKWNQYICGSKECSTKRKTVYGTRRYVDKTRKFKCRVCNTKVETKHQLQATCLSSFCRKESNRKQNLELSHKRKASIKKRKREEPWMQKVSS